MGDAIGHDPRDDCHIRPDLVAVAGDVRDLGASLIPHHGLVGDQEFDELFATPEDVAGEIPPDAQDSSEEFVSLRDLVSVFRVDDPHETSRRLNESGVAASPIHAVGFESHGGVMAGDDPAEINPLQPPNLEEIEQSAGVVAVVDSGIVPFDVLPHWMQVGVLFGSEDLESPDDRYPVATSHGTFVASVYRQVAPAFTVSLAAARPHRFDTSRLNPDPGTGGPAPTDELQVLAAVVRLINRHAGDTHQVKALNLSLGAHKCGDCCTTDNYLLLLRKAVREWRRFFGRNCPVFAAGGNTVDRRPVYPAAFTGVRGVGALAEGSNDQVVWSHKTPTTAPHRSWVDDAAIGSNVRGLSGQDDEHTVSWSGSSFATARAGAKFVSGQQYVRVDDGVTFWD